VIGIMSKYTLCKKEISTLGAMLFVYSTLCLFSLPKLPAS